MKHSEKKNKKEFAGKKGLLPELLMWGLPLLLAIPAMALSVRGEMAPVEALSHILLPTGLILIFLAAVRRVGVASLCLLPLMILAAFQIVLLFLYGDGSIIGVDMFLNVATTNSSEAMELLDNLLPAILTVLCLYLPPIVIAVIVLRRNRSAGQAARRAALWSGAVVSAAGAVCLVAALVSRPHYRVDEDFYPANVLCNLGSAIKRSGASATYHASCADYRFDASSSRPADEREIYIAVIGETSRADNWQLFGYNRFTTPYLCAMPDSALAAFPYTLSESNTTHKSVPLLLSALTAEEFDEHINASKSVITAFKEAGFRTDFVSMQARNHSYIDFFGQEADSTLFMREPVAGHIDNTLTDLDLLPVVDSIIARGAGKQLIVLHLYGSHFNYSDRYPRREAYFLPDLTDEATLANRGRLINAYDNSIRQTDRVLASLMSKIDSVGCVGALVYTSDHGEDIYDDARRRFLHASPTPTYFQLHVPFLVHMSPRMNDRYPELLAAAKANGPVRVSSSASFTPTLTNLAGISSPRIDETHAVTSANYRPVASPVFLNDRNRAETLDEAGFRSEDFERLRSLQSSYLASKLNL